MKVVVGKPPWEVYKGWWDFHGEYTSDFIVEGGEECGNADGIGIA